jgi:nitrogen-specific signal transduction histidine kinase
LKFMPDSREQTDSSHPPLILGEPRVIALLKREQRVSRGDREECRLLGLICRERRERVRAAEIVGVVGAERVEVRADSEFFEAFYTTKSDGSGLGLAESRELAQGMGGTLEYRDGSPGATFEIQLPSVSS